MQATVGILSATPADRVSGFQSHLLVRGTGVHLHDGYILTARHAVERDEGSQKVVPKEILVLTAGLVELPARLVGDSAYLDLVLYRVTETNREPLRTVTPFATAEARAGDSVFTIGYPLGWGPAMAFGHVGNVNTFLPTVETRLLQTDVPVCSGNSGGGLFNASGELVGILHAIIRSDQGQAEAHCSQLAFAVPAALAQRIVAALVEGKQPGFSWLGIQMTPIHVGPAWKLAVREATGPAKEGGLQQGDLIVAINDTAINNAAQLKNYLIERTVPGQRVTLRVLRDGQELQLTVTLGSR
jgi:serine protease Do